MRWAVLVLALAGCQASLGDPTTIADAGSGVDAFRSDARSIPDSGVPSADAPLPDALLCDDGDVNKVDPITGHCYMLFQTIESWVDARIKCGAIGAHLAVSTSVEENAIITPMAGLLDVWMGANDIDVEMTWVWLTGEAMAYENWRMGEPNDSNGEDCMILEGELNGSWDDRGCENRYAYVCER